MIQKVIAFLLLQSYLVAAFGLSLGQASCCDELAVMDEVACHDTGGHDLTMAVEDCSICLLTKNPEHTEDCCPDCEELYFSVSKDRISAEPFTNTGSKISLKNMQAVIAWLPWFLDHSIIALRPVVHPVAASPLLGEATPVPLFIWNCVYRT